MRVDKGELDLYYNSFRVEEENDKKEELLRHLLGMNHS